MLLDKIRDVLRLLVYKNDLLYIESVFVIIKSCATVGLEEKLKRLSGGIMGWRKQVSCQRGHIGR
jgi:hypothetical protein